ncbi:MAG TPA: glycosyltransferase [Candidatus Saccharimonadales bacterium]|nr:glycosyltransferase [Candidatus Saccharimonadales bacterium]
MKISFIATVYNEQETILNLLDSLLGQIKLPQEVIIVDGGSNDETFKIINNQKIRFEKKHVKLKCFIKKGNRSVGRNYAIENSSGDIIVCSDAGCVLDKDWIKNITEPFGKNEVDVVSGYYKGNASSLFQKCLIPYVLVMPNKLDHDKFLPASRSMGFIKSIWQKAGGFPEQFSNNEDFVFANKLKKINAKFVFQKNAFVYWLPRKNLMEAYIMFYRFALGDAEAMMLRPKVGLIFARYLFGILILILAIISKVNVLKVLILILLALYILWAIFKSYKYILDLRAIFILPVLQITSDIAVIVGTTLGLIKLWDTKMRQ